MVIKVYISRLSGNMEIKRKQEFVVSILSSRKIPFEEIDISDPEKEAEKRFMKEHSQPVPGETAILPPQIFNDRAYCGDYEAFFDANENVDLNDFLKIPGDSTDEQLVNEAQNGVQDD